MVRVVGEASLRHFIKVVRVRAVDIFSRRENEDRIRRHFAQDVDRAFDVCAKAIIGFVRIFTKVCSEMDDDVIAADASSVKWAENAQLRTSRQIFGVEELPHVCAEITTAACDENSQDLSQYRLR